MVRFLYRKVDGQWAPAIPQPVDADGINFADLQQVSDETGIPVEVLEGRWLREMAAYPPPALQPVPTMDDMIAKEMDTPLVFKVEDQAFRTYVTVEHLVDNEGRPAMGRCLTQQGLILISSQFPPATYEKTWFHEVGHATESHWPKTGLDAEGDREWETTHGISAHRQYNEQGGLATLLSLKPIAGVAPSYVCKPGPGASRDQLVRRKFSYLSEHQYDAAKSLWEEYKLNPRLNHFRVYIGDRGDVQIVPTLSGVISVVMYAPGFAGNPSRVFDFHEHDRRPLSCVSTVQRKLNGDLVTFSAEVFWRDQYGEVAKETDPTVMKYPCDSLGARADIRVLRLAYADVLGNLTVEEEESRGPQLAKDAARTWPDARRRR